LEKGKMHNDRNPVRIVCAVSRQRNKSIPKNGVEESQKAGSSQISNPSSDHSSICI
jgi:hypothetical protein